MADHPDGDSKCGPLEKYVTAKLPNPKDPLYQPEALVDLYWASGEVCPFCQSGMDWTPSGSRCPLCQSTLGWNRRK